MKKLLLIAAFMAALPSLALATDFHVAKAGDGGSNSNTCVQAQSVSTPKLTITAGLACATGGTHRVLVRTGSYTEDLNALSITIPNNVTLKNYMSEVVTLVGYLAPTNVSGMTVDGIKIDGTGKECGVCFNGTTNFELMNSDIFNAAVVIASSNTGGGDNDNIEIHHNRIHDNAGCNGCGTPGHDIYLVKSQMGPAEHWDIHDNEVYNALGDNNSFCITVYSNADASLNEGPIGVVLFHDNVVHDCRDGIGLHSTTGGKAYNNVVYNISDVGLVAGLFGIRGTDQQFINNLVFSADTCAKSETIRAIWRNNICFGNAVNSIVDTGTNSTKDHNLLGADPLWVNAGSADFRLRTGSPAIAAGLFNASVTLDITGLTRPNPPSIGPYDVTAAALFTISPTSGNQGATLNISVSGLNTNFVNATSVATFSGTGITVNSTTVSNALTAVVNITLAGGATLGARNMTMTTGSEVVTLTNGFTVAGAPTAPTNLRTVFDPLIAVPRIAIAAEGR